MDSKQSTSILELLYLIKAKNSGEMSFSEWVEAASAWARQVVAEQQNAAPPDEFMQTGD